MFVMTWPEVVTLFPNLQAQLMAIRIGRWHVLEISGELFIERLLKNHQIAQGPFLCHILRTNRTQYHSWRQTPASRYFQNKWETSPGLKSSHPLITLLRVQTILTLLCWLQRTANLDQKLCVLQWLDGNLNTWPFANSIWFIQSLALVSSSVLMKEIFSCKVPPYTR